MEGAAQIQLPKVCKTIKYILLASGGFHRGAVLFCFVVSGRLQGEGGKMVDQLSGGGIYVLEVCQVIEASKRTS